MEYLAFALAWPRFIDKPLREAKREALTDHVAPLFDALELDGDIEHWSHSFWGGDELGTKVIRVVAASDDPEHAAAQTRAALTSYDSEHYRIEAPHEPERFRAFWGDGLDTWLEARARLSSLSVAAIEEELGKPLAWHARQNRPGHIWANQLGLTYMDEASVYARLADGYLEQLPLENADEETKAAMAKVRDHLGEAIDGLPELG
ncbi:hypothetical protein [Halosegnis longus]|uniref:Uncharacterized protein n=1 Tax=Halosegnis longus TaxID=2216012 RepID=A0AAJ4R8I3_9EURY|nr:hypothetical protein [Halosegnis longus]RNJ26234.1 hypothetical protein Nmn1133_05785 [Salella cibi]